MIALASLDALNETHFACQQIKKHEPELFEELIHLISLTRQLQFRYRYMVHLLTGEDASLYTPKHARESVLELYHQEVSKLKTAKKGSILKQLFLSYKACGYDNICLLILGRSPEFLKGIHS